MESFSHSNREYEKLSKAIIKAISSSKEVKNIISHMKEKGATVDKSVLVFMLELGTIMAFSENFKTEISETKTLATENIDTSHIVDGRKLTKKEISFYRYSAEQFNEAAWLKKNKIIFDKE